MSYNGNVMVIAIHFELSPKQLYKTLFDIALALQVKCNSTYNNADVVGG